MSKEEKIDIRRGLRDVYIDRTRSSFIDGKKGHLFMDSETLKLRNFWHKESFIHGLEDPGTQRFLA